MKKEKRRVDDAGLKLVENSREDRAAVSVAQDVDCTLSEREIRRYEAETERERIQSEAEAAKFKVREEEKTKRMALWFKCIFGPFCYGCIALCIDRKMSAFLQVVEIVWRHTSN